MTGDTHLSFSHPALTSHRIVLFLTSVKGLTRKFWVESLAFTQISSFTPIGNTVIELREFKKKKKKKNNMDKMGILLLAIIFTFGAF